MNMRKIAVVGSFAAGAALAFAPLASADTPIDPSIIDSEISSLNALFTSDATLAGVPSTDIAGGGTGVFDTISSGDMTTVEGNGSTLFDELLYGFNPTNVTDDPGAYDVFNGALTKFDDALNFGVYALENGGAALPAADFSTDLFGISGTAATDLAGETASQAITTLLTDSFNDLLGYF